MTKRTRNTMRFYGGLFVLGCALLMIIVRIADWISSGEKIQLGVAAVFLPLGAMLMASSRRQSLREND